MSSGLGIFSPRSKRGVATPSTVPNMVPRPSDSSMRKKRTDQKGDPGMLMMASVNTTNASPVPSDF